MGGPPDDDAQPVVDQRQDDIPSQSIPPRVVYGRRISRWQKVKYWLRDNPWWGFIGVVLAVIALLPLITPADEPLRMNETRSLGDVAVRVGSVKCGTVAELNTAERQEIEKGIFLVDSLEDEFPFQICRVVLNVRNDSSDTQDVTYLQATLLVQRDRYKSVDSYTGSSRFLVKGET